jgi:adenylate kinase family enzyme
LLILLPGSEQPETGESIARILGCRHIRAEIRPDPGTGLASDELTCGRIIDALCKTGEAFVLSGYPINVVQAQALDHALARYGKAISTSIVMEAADRRQDRLNSDLVRYYRTQNKLVLVKPTETVEDACNKALQLYDRRRLEKT